MRKYIIPIIFILLGLPLSKSIAATISVEKFGILPGKNHNNTENFIKLSNWLEGKKNIVINIPFGTYFVGKQEVGDKNRVVKNFEHIFSLKGCENIVIKGNKSTIKFVDNLMYGSFDLVTKQPLTHKGAFLKGENAAYPGNCIFISNCKNISITNLILDGNNQHLIKGGIYGDNGIQLWHRGIYIKESSGIILTKLNIHHFGLDGIEFGNSSSAVSLGGYQIVLKNVSCTYNGRQGLSWTGGNGLKAEGCEFSHTGKAGISSNPGAGVDIEPESGICQNGYFIKCKFENNTGYAFGSDFFKLPIKNILFDYCTFGGTTGGSLFASNGGVTIDHSIIYGQIVRPSGLSKNERVIIKNSSIYDYNPNNGSFPKYATNHLIDAGGHRSYFDFLNCKIYIRKVKLCYIETGISDESLMPTFKNNIVYFNSDSYTKNDFIALFRGCIMANNEFIIDSKMSTNNGNFLCHQGVILKENNMITGNSKFIGWNSSGGPKNAK